MENKELLNNIEGMLQGRLMSASIDLKESKGKKKRFHKGRINAIEKIIEHLQHFKINGTTIKS